MTRTEFIADLKKRLKRLPECDRYEAIKYYEEYFDEAGIEHEQDVIKELRSAAHIASRILSDYAEKEVANAKRSAKGGLRALWFTILGIFAAPIAIPVAIILTVVIVLLCVALCVAVFALILGCGILTIAAVGMLFVRPGSAIMLAGIILIAIGVTKLLFRLVAAIIHGISSLVKKI